MIHIDDSSSSNLVSVSITGKLHADDSEVVRPQIDQRIDQYGKVRVLLDVRDFHGWADVQAARPHFAFVKNHHRVERIAIVAKKQWQHWIAAVVGVFLDPQEKCFDETQAEEARQWLAETG
jgi:hypothetical protein